MATLTTDQLTPIHRYCERSFSVVDYTKPTINAALQAIEDVMTVRLTLAGDVGQTIPQIISGAVNTATTPFVFSVAQKRALFAFWAELKFQRDK